MTGSAQAAAYRVNGADASSAAFYAVACDPSRSVAVEACAGAGKTWMLVARIVRALLGGTPAQDILAITFTKKAAGEMRARLQNELRRCETLPDAPLMETLQAWGFDRAQAQDRLAALRGLNATVMAQGRAVQVKTFHSWFASLLRSAPLAVLQELQLPLTYELLEDDERAKALVWPRFYRALLDLPEERQDFFDSVALYGRHPTLKSLETALSKRVEFAMADQAHTLSGSVLSMAQVFPELAGCKDPADFVQDSGAQTLLWDAARILGGASAKTYSAKGAELEQALTDVKFEGVCTALLTQKNEDRQFGNKIAQIDRVREAQALVRRLLQAEQQQRAWRHQQRLTRLTRVLLRVFSALKRERGWVDMNDLETAAQRLLADAELSGWMQQSMDARVSQLLIDEFQDTNPLQWQALYGWLSAYAGAGPGDAPSVFLVGDPKQSIYRFRRAEPQVFKAAQAFVVEGLGGSLLSCDHTRRCAPAVVQTLNTVMQEAIASGEYADFRDHTTHSAAVGEVLVLPAIAREAKASANPASDETLEWRDSLTTPRVPPEEDSYAALEAQQAARWVADHIAHGMPPEQIMVLSRKRERLGWMHQALLGLGIPSEQPEKLELNEMGAVQDVIALLDALVSPQHNLSLARALKSPLFGWADGELVALAEQVKRLRPRADALEPEPTWWQVLQGQAGEGAGGSDGVWAVTAERLQRYQQWVQQWPPHDALSAIYEDADVLARFNEAAQPGQRAAVTAALRGVLAQSLAQDGGRYLSTYRLVRSLKAGGTKLATTAKSSAVRLLTVHGAKGLEAKTVLLLDTDSGAAKSETMGVLIDWPGAAPAPLRFVFLERESEPPVCAKALLETEQAARALEEINALYVALTRAEERLVVSSFEPHRRGERATWWQRLRVHGQSASVPEMGPSEASPSLAPFSVLGLPHLPLPTARPPSSNLESLAVSDNDLRTRMGLAMHRLLQWHPTQSGFDWTDVHTQSVAREFDLTLEQAHEATAMAQRVVRGEGAWVFDASQLSQWGNEVDLFWAGEALRLDRLVHHAASGDAWVIDFKSHERPELQPELLAQIRRYGQAVANAEPGRRVRLAFINALGQWREVEPT
ncbi:MAG: UvrD-helicase domain-containing protein [Hydrogenophaga sp.]